MLRSPTVRVEKNKASFTDLRIYGCTDLFTDLVDLTDLFTDVQIYGCTDLFTMGIIYDLIFSLLPRALGSKSLNFVLTDGRRPSERSDRLSSASNVAALM